MALNEIFIQRGTPIVISSTGTPQLTFACGSGSGVQSSIFDLGSTRAEAYELFAEICAGTAPTAGMTYDIYLASANRTGRLPGGVTGVSGAYLTGTTIGANLVQLSYVGSVVATNASGIHAQSMIIYPIMRSGSLILKNSTNTPIVNLNSSITLTPLIPIIETA